MTLIRLQVDVISRYLEVHLPNSSVVPLKVPLSLTWSESYTLKSSQSRICYDQITALVHTSLHIANFFTRASGIPCTHPAIPFCVRGLTLQALS